MQIKLVAASLITALLESSTLVSAVDQSNSAGTGKFSTRAPSSTAQAERVNGRDPNAGKDYETAFRQSEWIGICEYQSYEKKDQIGFDNPPKAIYRVIRPLKCPSSFLWSDSKLPIRFRFSDNSDDTTPEAWQFNEDKMPKPKSKWIVFIPNFVPIAGHGFDTYRGSYGRQEATEKNIADIEAILRAYPVQEKKDDPLIDHFARADQILASIKAQRAQTASNTALQYTIHVDLLKCYHNLGKSVEEEAEYKWLLEARSSNALLHYNYAVLLRTQGKFQAAADEYEKAAQLDPFNVDYAGQCGQMFLYLKDYAKAALFLGKSRQMQGADKPILYDAMPRKLLPGPHHQKGNGGN